MKKVSLLLAAVVMTVGLTGCMSGGAKLPEGDVKVASQKVEGVVDLLLQSADYGKDMSTVCSLLLPQGSQYDVKLFLEHYADGKLINTTEIGDDVTDTIEKNSIIQIIMNVGNTNKGDGAKSIYSIAQVDKEKTKDEKNPQYKIVKFNKDALNYDAKSEVTQIGKNLDEEFPLASYVKFKDGDSEKKPMDLEKYNEELSNYKEVNIIKIKVTKK